MQKKWWHDKIAYQIYPKSFLDTTGNGIGDLRGIISRLDYLKWLGIDILWLSPIYKSPFVDQGYDISDYYAIAEEFGTMDDFDELLAEAKKRDMYILMDLVVNHCSSAHAWFQQALADPAGKYGDYFYFRRGKNGQPPSNYRGYFGGSTWEKVAESDLYYLHFFAKEQPDLNWENKEMVQKLYDMINWWLEKGLAGFRIDAIINIKKDLAFPNFPADGPDGLVHCTRMVQEADGVGDLLDDLRRNTFARYDAFTVGEVFDMKPEELDEFIGENGHFSTMFDFSGEILSMGKHGWYDAPPQDFTRWRDATFDAQRHAEGIGFFANIIENHDEPRGFSRYLPAYAQNPAGAKMLATVSILLRGIPFIYQGQEIGMSNCRRTSIADYDDISTQNEYHLAREAGLSEQEALDVCYHFSRDNARTPMQWSDAPHAGFTTGTPWLAENPQYKTVNVTAEQADNTSILHYYKRLLALRKSDAHSETFVYGQTIPRWQESPHVFAYERTHGTARILVAANFGPAPVVLSLQDAPYALLLSNMPDSAAPLQDASQLTLRPQEALVLDLCPPSCAGCPA